MSERLRILDELGAELDRAARGGSAGGSTKTLGTVMVAVAALVAVAVAFAAIVGFGQRSHHSTSADTRTPAVPVAARQLVAELGVLRRPQTPGDRTLPEDALRAFGAGIVPRLTRLASNGARRIYLIVSSPRCGARTDLVSLVTLAPNGVSADSPGFTATDLERFAIVPTGLGSIISSVVPDGVTKVAWGWKPKPDTSAIESATVEHNVARGFTAFGRQVSRATWHFRNGRTLTSRNEAIVSCPTPNVLLGSSGTAVPRSLSRDFGLFRRLPPTPLAIATSYATYFSGWKLGLNFAQARFVHTGAGQLGGASGVWVIPGAHGICIMEGVAGAYDGGNGVCSVLRYPEAKSGGMRFSDRDGGGRNTYSGLVPDGSAFVSLVLPGGNIKRVRVVDNVYSVTIDGQAIALLDHDSAGRPQRFPLSVNYNMF